MIVLLDVTPTYLVFNYLRDIELIHQVVLLLWTREFLKVCKGCGSTESFENHPYLIIDLDGCLDLTLAIALA